MIFFSIIIPTYNRAHLITYTLDSIRNQYFKEYEVIIVDDGSNDNTKEVVENYIKINSLLNWCYYFKVNEERGAARNYGTKLAKGKYINWFDSDDLAIENHLNIAKEFYLKLDSPEVFHLAYKFTTPNGELIRNVNNFSSTNNYKLIIGNNLSCNGVFVRSDIALQNLFNEDRELSASEDYELWIRLAAKYTIHCSNTVTSIIIQHDERSVLTMKNPDKLINRFSLFLRYINNNEEVLKFIGKNHGYFMMKNNLLLSVDLAANGNTSKSFKYLKIACLNSWKFIQEKTFYAILKNIILSII